MSKRLTTEIFIERAKKVHGDKYDYDKVEYKTTHEHVCIVCPEHGEFWQRAGIHLSGSGCPECAIEVSPFERQLTTEIFIKRAKKIHGDKYDYSKVNYVNKRTKVEIVCSEHGSFWQLPGNHFNLGNGCPKCNVTNRINYDEFVRRARLIHGNKYDYSKVKYIRNKDKVCIICPEHGEFWQRPDHHLQGEGCPCCRESNLERVVRFLLDDLNINYLKEKSFSWLCQENSIQPLMLDFYISDRNLAVECQGIQHFRYEPFLQGYDYDNFLAQNMRDDLKNRLCKEHGIEILYFAEDKPYVKGYRYPVITDINDLKYKLSF